MKFRMNASGFFATYADGTTEELDEKTYQTMLRRQMMAKARAR